MSVSSGKNFTRRFACFTLDDGYRDHALPVLREFDAPCIVYAVSDFAAGTGRLWWVALERAIANATTIEVEIGGRMTRMEATTATQKQAAFDGLHDWLRALPGEHDVLREVEPVRATRRRRERDLPRALHVLGRAEGLRQRSAGDDRRAHHTHPNVARQSEQVALNELRASRERIEAALGRGVLHLAYPYGDRIAAGPREFAPAKAADSRPR